jgi:hypothetical protein
MKHGVDLYCSLLSGYWHVVSGNCQFMIAPALFATFSVVLFVLFQCQAGTSNLVGFQELPAYLKLGVLVTA